MDNIKEQFKKVIAYSQNIKNPKVDEIFEEWERNKQYYIKAWGGLTKSLGHVKFSLDENNKSRMIANFIDYCYENLGNTNLANFVEMNEDAFFDNKVIWSDNQKVPVGMKLSKAFKHYEKNPVRLDEAQSLFSRYLQENKVEGELIVSVHPLDFLSISENTYNWRSCHALDGDYAAGNLSYMMDKSTIICYLKGDKEVKLPRFPEDVLWNNKKWRVLLFNSVGSEAVFAGRQYPFSSKEGINYILDNLNIILNNNIEYTAWFKTYSDEIDRKYASCNGYKIYLDNWVGNKANSLNYNDLTDSTCYNPYYTVDILLNFMKLPIFDIGHEVFCLECDEHLIYNDESHGMICFDCYWDNHCITCDKCGTKIYSNDSRGYLSDGSIVCEYCYENEVFYCSCCRQLHWNEEKVWDKVLEEYICEGCYERMKELG